MAMAVGSGRVDFVKVFISSPDDAADLRDLAEDIIQQDINSITYDLLGLILYPDRWENWVPTVADRELESVYLSRAEESQVFVCILRRQYGHGTDQELQLALQRRHSGEIEKVYVFCEKTDDAQPQLNNLKEWMRQQRVFWRSFEGRDDFGRAFTQAMWRYVIELKAQSTATSSAGGTL